MSHVFDWVVTTDNGLVELINTDLNGMFARDRLEWDPENCIIDRVTRTQFLYEFPDGSDFTSQFEEHAGRYAMLAERWRDLLRSNGRVQFVQQNG